ncbi:hypothetical protein [Priestia megaterium]|uniref:hypothetical protein n=1 Tax=Priestia megaterium TaxID=1404 RepID=UPI002E233C15|nr:hypothetical protein [Priestia megaterium]
MGSDENHKKVNRHSNSCPRCGFCTCCCVIKCRPGKHGKQGPPGRQGATGPQVLNGVTGATGATGSSGGNTKAILFGGVNTGFQRIAGSPGATSQTIPYVTGGAGNIVGFSGSINVNNLSPGTYNFEICSNVNNNASVPTPGEIISTIALTVLLQRVELLNSVFVLQM